MIEKVVTPYHLGIIWSIGTYQENRFIFRYREKYFLEQLQQFADNKVYPQQSKSGTQYVLKTRNIDINNLIEFGWTERNAEQRNIPLLQDYKDFLRAYCEIHSAFSWQTTYYRRTKNKYYRLRFRIYGNGIMLQSISNLLHEQTAIAIKTLQKTGNNKTFYLQYTGPKDIESIHKYIEGRPCYEEYWNNAKKLMQSPIKPG